MKNNIANLLFAICLAAASGWSIASAQQSNPDPLAIWEKEEAKLDSKWRDLKESIQNDQDKLEENLQLQMQNTKDQAHSDTQSYLIMWLGLGTVLTIGAGIGMIFKIRQWSRETAKAYANSYLDGKGPEIMVDLLAKAADSQKAKIRAIVQAHEWERQVKEEQEFLVIHHDMPEELEHAKHILEKEMKFGKPRYTSVPTYEECMQYPLVIIWAIRKPFNDELILRPLFNRLKDAEVRPTSFLYFTEDNENPLVKGNRPICNGANSAFTLYGHLLQTLKYTELRKQGGAQ